MSLAQDMLYFRAKHRIGQRKFAEMCGLTTQTINRVEREVQKPSKMTEIKIRMAMEEQK